MTTSTQQTTQTFTDNNSAGLYQLKQINNWVCWKYELDDKGKWTKVPKNPKNGKNAKSNDPSTWGMFALALASMEKFRFDGIGFMLEPSLKLVGIDLDDCITNGEVDAWAMNIVHTVDSYTEITPSGKGLRSFLYGTLPPNGRKRKPGIEIYTEGRFLTITGNHLEGTSQTINDRTAEILQLHNDIFAPPLDFSPQPELPKTNGNSASVTTNLSDLEILKRTKKDDKFNRLWNGDISEHGNDDSAADLALCNKLAFYTDKNATQMDRLFRQSKLMRPKWDKKHGAKTYGQMTIDEAIAFTDKVYIPFVVDDSLLDFIKSTNGNGPHSTNNSNSSQQAGQQLHPFSHNGLRDTFLRSHPYPLVYGLGDWREYSSGIWQPVEDLSIEGAIADTIERVKGKLTASLVSSVSKLVKMRVAKPETFWDANPDYLVCGNGTLQISTRQLFPHSPDLYITSGVGYDYDPFADCPNWDKFLNDLVAATSKEVVEFLQEFAGYALTTDTRYEIAIWLYGVPGGGKSTFLVGLEAMLDKRVGQLGLANIERSNFALAKLPGKTLVISTEQPSDFMKSSHTLNQIISGETITIEMKFKDPYDITPKCKMAWAMNELPRVPNPNDGIFRRVKVVTFPPINPQNVDPSLKEKIKLEGAGILNWALDGLERLYKRGCFSIPKEVGEATQEFKEKNDIPKVFADEKLLTGMDANKQPYTIKSRDLYNAYRDWCIVTGHRPASETTIANDWKRLNFEKYDSGGYPHWRFVTLKP